MISEVSISGVQSFIPTLVLPRYDIFSAAAHRNQPPGALEICHAGGSAVGEGLAISIPLSDPELERFGSRQMDVTGRFGKMLQTFGSGYM